MTEPSKGIDAVINLHPTLAPESLRSVEIGGFPQYWYVTAVDGGMPTIGGLAYVVERVGGFVHEVPASVPPRVNCQSISERRFQ